MKQTIASLRSRITLNLSLALVAMAAIGCQTPTPPDSSPTHTAFDERTSGQALVDAALARARTDKKNVILLFGANWCPYCRQLHALLKHDPDVSALVQESFVVVPIDVGTSARNRNTSVIDRFGATVYTDGVPSVVVIDAEGKRLAPTYDNPWSAKNRIEAGPVMEFLRRAGG